MADYFEQADQQPHEPLILPASFVRPINLDRRSATSHASGLTYVTDFSSHGAPPEPIFGMPTPVIPGQTSQLPGDFPEKDPYTMVDPDPEYQPGAEQVQGGRKGFVGGFVSGLKKLPRVMLRHPRGPTEPVEKKPQSHWRRGSEGGSVLPRYQTYSADPPLDPANVEVVQGMEMPIPHAISVTSPSLRESQDPDPDRTMYSDRHQSRPNTVVTQHGGESTLIHQTPINIDSPAHSEPQPASDYDKMSSVLQVEPSVSIAQHINRMQKFFNDINELPWVSSRVAVDYIPEKNGRRGTGKHKTPKASETWYPSQVNDLDLLSSGSPGSVPAATRRREGGHRRAYTETTMSPTGTGTSRRSFDSPTTNRSPRYSVTSEPTPGGRSVRHTSTPRRHHQRRPSQQSSPAQPALYPYIAAPQPMYMYSGPPPSPPTLQQQPGSPGQGQGQVASPAMPVYMIPMPPPVYQQMPSGYPYPVTSPPVRPS